jgi:hypothetical protein
MERYIATIEVLIGIHMQVVHDIARLFVYEFLDFSPAWAQLFVHMRDFCTWCIMKLYLIYDTMDFHV